MSHIVSIKTQMRDPAALSLACRRLGLAELGHVQITRAGHVEPDEQGQWQADLSPVHGPILGPFSCRSLALAAEQAWLERWLIDIRSHA